MKPIIVLAILAACSGRTAPIERIPAPQPAQPGPALATTELEAASPAAAPGPSIYDLPIQLRDADDRTVGLDVARGKPVLISMFYASCPVACPVLVAEIGQVIAALPPELQRDIRVVLVSFDPDRDTPAKLHELARERRLDERWTLAVASEPDARALAAVLGVKYRKLDNGEFFHGSTIVVLDSEGRPVARTDSLGQRATLIAAIR